MTPETTDGLTDKELIQELGLRVMGWRMKWNEWAREDLLMKDEHTFATSWNPLKSWDDCMELRNAAVAKVGRRAYTEALEIAFLSHSGFASYEMLVAEADQRDHCLAALKCVQATKSV